MNLGAWVGQQRKVKKKGKLSADRERCLESLGMEWDPLIAQWEEMFALLETYKRREGHCNVPRGHEADEVNLGAWVTNQRTAKRKGVLSADKDRRLESLGIVWSVLKAQWEEMFSLLEKYKAREGHCNVPYRHEEDEANLGYWVGTQRQAKKKGKLSADKERRLEDLGFVLETKQQ